MIDNIDFEQYKKYIEYIQNEMLKLCGIPKNLQEERKNYDTRNNR